MFIFIRKCYFDKRIIIRSTYNNIFSSFALYGRYLSFYTGWVFRLLYVQFHHIAWTLSCWCRSGRLAPVRHTIGRLPEAMGPVPGNSLGQPDALCGGRDLSHISDNVYLHVNDVEDGNTARRSTQRCSCVPRYRSPARSISAVAVWASCSH